MQPENTSLPYHRRQVLKQKLFILPGVLEETMQGVQIHQKTGFNRDM